MKSISGKRLCKIVEQKGWVLRRITSSHHIYENPEVKQILSIPVHCNQDLKVGTARLSRSRRSLESLDENSLG